MMPCCSCGMCGSSGGVGGSDGDGSHVALAQLRGLPALGSSSQERVVPRKCLQLQSPAAV